MTTSLDLEYKYRVEVAGAVVLLPFTLAKKQTTYPDLCIFEHDEPMPTITRTHLCWRCTEWLREQLTTIAERWPDLEDALAPAGGRAASSERVSGTGDLYPPLPINGDVSDLMRDARNAVWSTVGQLVQDRPDLRMPADHGTGVLADWLARWHVDYLASHPSGVGRAGPCSRRTSGEGSGVSVPTGGSPARWQLPSNHDQRPRSESPMPWASRRLAAGRRNKGRPLHRGRHPSGSSRSMVPDPRLPRTTAGPGNEHTQEEVPDRKEAMTQDPSDIAAFAEEVLHIQLLPWQVRALEAVWCPGTMATQSSLVGAGLEDAAELSR